MVVYDIQLEDSNDASYIVKTSQLPDGDYEIGWSYRVSKNLYYNLLVQGNSKYIEIGFNKYSNEEIVEESYAAPTVVKVKTASGNYLNQASLKNGFKILFTDHLLLREVITAKGNRITIKPYKMTIQE